MGKRTWLGKQAFVAVAFLGCALTAPAAHAQLRFLQPTAEVGAVYTGKPLIQRFEFVNAGSQPVEFVDAHASCACLKPKLPEGPIPPGQQGWVELEVHTLGQKAGPIAWRADLRYRSGAQVEEAALLIRARLVAEVTADPAALQMFATRSAGAEITIRTVVPFQIVSVQTSSPHLQARWHGPLDQRIDPMTYRIQLEVDETFPEGRHEEIISIYTDAPAYPELKVPVTVVKSSRERVSAAPREVQLLAQPGQTVPSRIILLRDAENQAVVVERVTAADPALSCSWAPGPGNYATLKIQVDHTRLPPTSLRSSVRVDISRPAPQTVTIPVQVLLTGAKP